MAKYLAEFERKGEEAELKVIASFLPEEEFLAVRTEVETIKNWKYDCIYAGGFEGSITGSYEEVLSAMKTLEQRGWKWMFRTVSEAEETKERAA